MLAGMATGKLNRTSQRLLPEEDQTLQPFKEDRMKTPVTKAGEPKQVSLTTRNRSLERVRTGSRYAKKFGRPASWCFAHARVHDLLHTFGRRLRATGVSEETRKVLLVHRNGDITTHYPPLPEGDSTNEGA